MHVPYALSVPVNLRLGTTRHLSCFRETYNVAHPCTPSSWTERALLSKDSSLDTVHPCIWMFWFPNCFLFFIYGKRFYRSSLGVNNPSSAIKKMKEELQCLHLRTQQAKVIPASWTEKTSLVMCFNIYCIWKTAAQTALQCKPYAELLGLVKIVWWIF